MIDPSEHTIDELEEALQDIDDPDQVDAVLTQEKQGENRKGAKELIEARRTEVDPLDHPTYDKQYVREKGGHYEDMWVYCETQQGELIDVTLEMLGKARELMDEYNEEYDADERVIAVLVGDDVERHAETVIEYGADVAVYQEDEALDRFLHKPFTEAFCDMARADTDWKEYDLPRYVVFPATNNGRDLSAQVQAELDSGLASDCSDLFIEDVEITNPAKTEVAGESEIFERVLHMKRPDFSGFEYSTILCLDTPERDFHPQGASVIPGSFDLPDADPEREGEVVEYDMDVEDEWLRVHVTEYDQLDEGIDLTGHEVVVALGRGIGDDPTGGMELGLELRDAFDDAELGITRGIVTSSYEFDGHVEQYAKEERQIGETGQIVEPDVYIAAGISGAIQHKVGMDESDVIVSINTDTDADIVDFSDYFIEGDLFEVLPMLTEAVESGDLDVAALADGGVVDE